MSTFVGLGHDGIVNLSESVHSCLPYLWLVASVFPELSEVLVMGLWDRLVVFSFEEL